MDLVSFRWTSHGRVILLTYQGPVLTRAEDDSGDPWTLQWSLTLIRTATSATLHELRLTVERTLQQSGSHPGGDSRGRDAFGDRGSGANIFSNGDGVDGSGVGDTVMALGGNSNSGMDGGSRGHDSASVNGRGVVAHGDAIASTGAFGFQAPSGGFGKVQRGGCGCR